MDRFSVFSLLRRPSLSTLSISLGHPRLGAIPQPPFSPALGLHYTRLSSRNAYSNLKSAFTLWHHPLS